MELKLKGITYGIIMSHIFPGLLLCLEVALAFKLFTSLNLFCLLASIENNVTNVTTVIVAVIVSSTIFGFILDGIHHLIFEDLPARFNKDKENDGLHGPDFYKACNSTDKMSLYIHFIEDDLYYPYEAYANIAFAMLPGSFLLPCWLSDLGVGKVFITTIEVIYIAIVVAMFIEAKETLNLVSAEEEKFIQDIAKQKEPDRH